MQMRFAGKRTGLLLIATTAPLLAYAQNECRATVVPAPNGVTTAGPIVTLTFDVKTECEASAGHFTYTFRTSANPKEVIERNALGWKANDGKVFKVKEEFAPGAGVKVQDVKVLPNIRSTKVK